jgi:hypothetical protein
MSVTRSSFIQLNVLRAMRYARKYVEERARGNTTRPVHETVQFCDINQYAWGLPLHFARPEEPWVLGVRVEPCYY